MLVTVGCRFLQGIFVFEFCQECEKKKKKKRFI
jgi:hypothetical protein